MPESPQGPCKTPFHNYDLGRLELRKKKKRKKMKEERFSKQYS